MSNKTVITPEPLTGSGIVQTITNRLNQVSSDYAARLMSSARSSDIAAGHQLQLVSRLNSQRDVAEHITGTALSDTVFGHGLSDALAANGHFSRRESTTAFDFVNCRHRTEIKVARINGPSRLNQASFRVSVRHTLFDPRVKVHVLLAVEKNVEHWPVLSFNGAELRNYASMEGTGINMQKNSPGWYMGLSLNKLFNGEYAFNTHLLSMDEFAQRLNASCNC